MLSGIFIDDIPVFISVFTHGAVETLKHLVANVLFSVWLHCERIQVEQHQQFPLRGEGICERLVLYVHLLLHSHLHAVLSKLHYYSFQTFLAR